MSKPTRAESRAKTNKNLKPFRKGEKRASVLGKIANAKSQKVRAEKKSMREYLDYLATQESDVLKGMTRDEAIGVILFTKAEEGNVKAYEVIRDTRGQKPITQVQAEIKDNIRIDLNLIQ